MHASRLRSILSVLAVAAAPAAVSAQASFKDGDLYVLSHSLPGASNSGVVRVDPASGASQQILGPGLTVLGPQIRFDPFRSKLLLRAQPAAGPSFDSWVALDADGSLTPVAGLSTGVTHVAPTGDGRVYAVVYDQTLSFPVKWIDAANVAHDVTDGGGAPVKVAAPNASFADMIYEPTTNSIWLLDTLPGSAVGWSTGAVASVTRVSLDVTGTQALGPAQTFPILFGAPANSLYIGADFSYGPNGQILTTVRFSTGTNPPCTVLVNPLTMGSAVYAGLTGLTLCDSAVYSRLLNRAVGLDTFNDELRAYAQGSTGAFLPLASGQVSSAGGSSEVCMITEARPAATGLTPYGAGTPGCQGPIVLGATMTPRAGAPDFRLLATNAPPSSLGLTLVTDAPDLFGSDPFGIGVLLHVDLFAAGYVESLDIVSNALGLGTTPAPITLSPAIVGLTFDVQTLWAFSTCALPPFGLASSNGLAVTIQP